MNGLLERPVPQTFWENFGQLEFASIVYDDLSLPERQRLGHVALATLQLLPETEVDRLVAIVPETNETALRFLHATAAEGTVGRYIDTHAFTGDGTN